jgi:inorganic triphosphatase YgiF
MEVEAKFAITGELESATVETLNFLPYTLRSRGAEEHVDTLLDTVSRRVTSRMFGLRVRDINGALTLTLKGPNIGTSGVHERQEWEAPLEPPLTLRAELWPEPIASMVLDLIGAEPLVPLFRVAVRRRVWDVKRGSRVIGELALDTGAILAAGRREEIRELELELKGSGARADLETLASQLTTSLPLRPEARSKLHRGLALLRRARWALDGYTPIVALARHYVRQKRRAALDAKRHVIKAGDPDAIHDMRVAVRRIRSALLEIEGIAVFDGREARAMRKRLRGIARQLGVVRDLDIIAAQIVKRGSAGATEQRRHSEIGDILANIALRRKDAYEAALRMVESERFGRLLERLRRCDIAQVAPDGTPSCAGAREFAGGILWSRYDAMVSHGEAIDLGVTSEMHQARIMAKRLRYVLEVFAPALGDNIAPLRQALMSFQEAFGTLQDLSVTLQTLEDYMGNDAPSRVLMRLTQELEMDRARALTSARSAWRALSAQEMRETLAKVVAVL